MKKDNQKKLASEWILKGQSDLETAEILLREKGPTDTLCFHCQQAVEKFLKAYIVFSEDRFEKIHDLWKLAKLAGKTNKKILEFEKELKTLTAYYIESRYPSDSATFSRKECREALRDANEITQYILKAIGK